MASTSTASGHEVSVHWASKIRATHFTRTQNTGKATAEIGPISISRYDYGVNVFCYDEQLTQPSTVSALNALGMGMQQFPNENQWSWTRSASRPGSPNPVSLAMWGQILSETNSQGLFIFDYDENPNWTGGGTPQDAVQLVQYILQNHLPINAIAIGSEEYGAWDFAANLNPSKSAAYYATQAAAIAQAIHRVDPSMLVGLSFDTGQTPYDLSWDQTVLRVDAPYINFVSIHVYPLTSPLSDSGFLTQLPLAIASTMQFVKSEISANVPPGLAPHIQIWVTEFNPYGQPTAQSTQPVYGAALVESALLWRALGASKVIFWSFDGQAHDPNAPGYPVATTTGDPYGLFALVGDGQSPELSMNAFYPSAIALAALMQAIGSSAQLTVWAGSDVLVGQVVGASGVHAFVINQSPTAMTLNIGGATATLDPASMSDLILNAPITSISQIGAALYATDPPLPGYQPLVPQLSSVAAPIYPGESLTIQGRGFGDQPGYVVIQSGNVQYGAPGNAYKIDVTSWSPTSVTFIVPDGYSGPGLTPGTTVAIQLVTAANLVADAVSATVTSPPLLPASITTPTPVVPGEWVTVTGEGFGNTQGSGYVWIQQAGINWGAPGNWYPVLIHSWTDHAVTFLVPTGAQLVDGRGEAPLQPGTATVEIINNAGGRTAPLELSVGTLPPAQAGFPSITRITALSNGAIQIAGSDFGTEPSLFPAGGGGYDQGTLEITDDGTQANYGFGVNGSGNWYGLNIMSWTNTQIVLTFGPATPSPGAVLTVRLFGQQFGYSFLASQATFTYQ